MSRIILGWQLSRPIDDARVRALMEQIGHRYQPLFLERLQGVGLWQGNQGLLHIDVPRAGDAGLDRSDERNLPPDGPPDHIRRRLPASARPPWVQARCTTGS